MKNYDRNDFKLTFLKEYTKFYVNEMEETVACTVIAELKTPQESNYDANIPFKIPYKIIRCSSVASCHNGDIFDVEKGKRIALAKAENKAYRKASSYLFESQKHLNFLSSSIDKFISKGFNQCLHNDEYVQIISDVNHPKYKENVSKVQTGNTFFVKSKKRN